MALDWLRWRARAAVDAVVAAAVGVAGVTLGDIDLHFAWQAWHFVTSSFVLHGRRGTCHTQLCHTASFATSSFTHQFVAHHLSHTQLCHTLSFTHTQLSHNFVTHHLSHTTLSHALFHTPSSTPLCHTPSLTHHL